jgi:membrane protein implicated in regulation of membrane protease activity
VGGFVFLVPPLLVVVAGYAVGYVVAEALGVTAPEAVAWPAGFLLLAVTVVALLRYRRRRRRARSSPPSSGPPSRRR